MDTAMPNTNSAVAEEVRRPPVGRRRVNQTQLAEALGLNQSTMSRRRPGTQPFTISQVDAIAAFFDVPISDLFGGFRTGRAQPHTRCPDRDTCSGSWPHDRNLAKAVAYRAGWDHLAVADHLQSMRRRGLRDRTITQRRRVLTRLQRHTGKALVDVGVDELLEFVDRPQSAESRATEISHLRGFYSWGARHGPHRF